MERGELTFSEMARQLDYPRYPENAEDPIRILARLPLKFYITTSQIDFLERALLAEGKQPRTQICFWSKVRDSILLEEHRTDPNFSPSVMQPMGTEATLSVATDADIYASGATVETSASVRNGGFPLAGAGLHLEIVRPCAPHPDSEETSFHFETWDGQGWVERAVRHRGPLFETDQVDLTPYWPDPDGEYKVRIRHVGALASLDFVSLVSDGALVAPTAAAFDWGGDFLPPFSPRTTPASS